MTKSTLISQNQLFQKILYRELDPAFARRARLLVQGLELEGNEKVLEIGCGRGFYEALLSTIFPKLDITAIDRSDEYLEIAQRAVMSKQVRFENQDALALPYKANTFDRVFATEVLEHLPDDRLALREMYRVLKPGGVVMITVPNQHYPLLWDPINWSLEHVFQTHISKDIWWLAGIWADHERLYTETDLHHKAKRAGFQIDMSWRATHAALPFTHFILYGIGKNLVEKGYFKDLYRFSINSQPSQLLRMIRRVVYSRDGQNQDSEPTTVSTVNLIMKLRKPR